MAAKLVRYLVPVVLLLVQLEESRNHALAKPLTKVEDMVSVGSMQQELRLLQPAASQQLYATEVADLLSSPSGKQKKHHKKHKSNTSGKSKEGGFYKSYGSDADGEKGYLKKTFGKGEHGYKNYDTFHKKMGDKYGFEKHEAYGQGKDHEGQASQHKHKRKQKVADHEGAGTDDVETYADEGDGEYYSEGSGDGEYYSGDDGGSSYSGSGEAEGYYASGEAADGSAESYSSDGSGEDSDY